ncbi:MAG TPA: hypothetical protein VFS43_03265 [Polyangiaceae bacterium]|nr:hypothetical protein [Polyangiaceae bacterium]
MKQRLTYLLPFVALAALAAANGCGDDDDDSPGTKGAAGASGTGGRSGTGGTGGTGGQAGTGGAGGGGAGAGQGGGGAGGAGQGGGGAGGVGGVPNVTPADTCETAPKATMPANQLGSIVQNQTFGTAASQYDFTCQGNVVIKGPDLVFNVVAPAVGVMTVRTKDVEGNLNVTLVARSECVGDAGPGGAGGAAGAGTGETYACADNTPKGTPPPPDTETIFFTTTAGQESFVFVENTTIGVADSSKFSLEAYFNQAVSDASSDSCAAAPTPLAVQLQNTTNPELTDRLVTGTTTGSGGDIDVPLVDGCSKATVPDQKAGAEEVFAVTPAATGTLAVFVERARGETAYVPVVSIREGGCSGTAVKCSAGSAAAPAVATSLNVTAGQTYHIVVDSLNAATSGQYLATAFLIPAQGAVIAQEPSRYPNGTRYVVRDPAGTVLRVIERANQ